MKCAIFSDIHNNITALNAVLKDIRQQEIDHYFCLGDIGDDQNVNLLRQNQIQTIFGNSEVSSWRYLSESNQKWILNLPPQQRFADQNFWLSHASPTWPETIQTLAGYLKTRRQTTLTGVFPYYLDNTEALVEAFSTLMAHKIQVLFHGHTHRQQIWNFTPDNQIRKYSPMPLTLEEDHFYIIGVGSVGQPRDIPKPSYLIFDSVNRKVQFVRV